VARAFAVTALAVLAVAVAPATAGACDKYAAHGGNDAAAGTAAHPYRTAQRLVSALEEGATGCLVGGSVFSGRVVITRQLVLRGVGDSPPAIVGGVTFTTEARDAVLEGVTVRGAGAGRAAVLVNADGVRIVDDEISGTGYVNRNTACVLLAGPRDVVIDSNRIESCTTATQRGLSAAGIFVGSAYNTLITNNVVVHTAGIGIWLWPNAQRTRVVHNLVDGNTDGIVIAGNDSTASSYNVVEANIVSNSGGNNIRASWGRVTGHGNVVVSNCLWHGVGGDVSAPSVKVSGNLVTSPQYVNRPTDYTVRSAACAPKRPSIVGVRLPVLPAFRVGYHVRALAKRVQIVSLRLTGLVKGARISAACVKSCSANWTSVAAGSSIAVGALSGKWLPVGAQLAIRATQAGHTGVWALISVTGLPNGISITHGCLRLGSSALASCRGLT
jgi:Right handed beta helix region